METVKADDNAKLGMQWLFYSLSENVYFTLLRQVLDFFFLLCPM